MSAFVSHGGLCERTRFAVSLDRAGIERLHAHLWRHTAATHYLVSGGNTISLQQKLGHTTLAMTSQYVHLAGQHLAVINERVSPMDRLDIRPMRVPRGR